MTIAFTKSKLPFGWLGNMSAYTIVYDGKRWRNAESLFQSLRFSDETIKEEIRSQKSPMGAKIIAKKNWEKMTVLPKSEKDLENMEIVLRLKIEQHPELKTTLLNTGDQEIIEDVSNRPGVFKEAALENRHTFWGMALRDGVWFGENTLGKIWMKIRSEMRAINERNS